MSDAPTADVCPTHAAPPPTASGSRRLLGPELLRAVAALAVITIHASAWPQYSLFWIDLNAAMRFSVPAFVLLAGLVLAYSYHSRPLGMGFLKRRMSRSLLPWLIWAPVYLALGLGLGQIGNDSRDISTWIQEGGGHLYFLLIIPQLYLLFLLWPRHHRWWFAAAAMALQLTAEILRLYTSVPNYWWDYFTLWYGTLYFPYWIGFFGVGIALAGELRPQGWKLLASVVAAAAVTAVSFQLLLQPVGGPNPAYATGTGAFVVPLMIPFTLGITVLLLLLGPLVLARGAATVAAVALVSRYSLGIYIIHPALLALAMAVMGSQRLSQLVTPGPSFVLFVALLLLASLSLCRALAATPLRIMIGIERPRRRAQDTVSAAA